MEQMISMTKNRPRYNEQMLPMYPVTTMATAPQVAPAVTAPTPALTTQTVTQPVVQPATQVIQAPPPVIQYAYPPYCSGGPIIEEIPYHLQENYESERYRNRVLERQLQNLAREHAREKQDHINKIKEIK